MVTEPKKVVQKAEQRINISMPVYSKTSAIESCAVPLLWRCKVGDKAATIGEKGPLTFYRL
jgi:hypothetical protein